MGIFMTEDEKNQCPGFTREDVEALREIILNAEGFYQYWGETTSDRKLLEVATNLADCIEALLPPESP